MIYQYVMEKYYELRFSGIADDIFTRIRDRVDAQDWRCNTGRDPKVVSCI